MKKTFFIKPLSIFCALQLLLITQMICANQPSHYISLLKEMFTKVTIEKNSQAIPVYYDKDFELYSNGQKMGFKQFLKLHQNIYITPIQYKVSYDENTLIEQGNKVSGRLFITTKIPNDPSRKIEVILIATYKKDKLYRLWELTYPDWSKMKSFR